MLTQRLSGLLLHPTSLPGPFGIGDLGPEAYRFVDFLVAAGQRIWQVLPLGPTGYGDSPYQSFSAFAGNPLLASPEQLVEDDWIAEDDLANRPGFPADQVDFGRIIPWKRGLLDRAYERFAANPSEDQRAAFDTFCTDNAPWLDDYALFMALKESREYAVWTAWGDGLANRNDEALAAARQELGTAVDAIRFAQFQFFTQWERLRQYANERDILIVGDVPIYVAHDSVDVWANPAVFQLDEAGEPTVVGGVPPDYFSKTGQLWGNPIYRWDDLADSGYAWWIERLRGVLRLCDIVRLDHFRGFEGYWEVAGGEKTAVNGRWVDGPRDGLFEALREALGDPLPIIAENLGVITDEVEALRERFGMPGMAVLQFGFGEDEKSSGFPIHNYTRDLVAYTGTHDNEPTAAWWARTRRNRPMREYLKTYLDTSGRDFNWTAIRALMASVANTAIFPVQDLLGLGKEARMNTPGNPAGNWTWRLAPDLLNDDLAARLHKLTDTYGRLREETDEA